MPPQPTPTPPDKRRTLYLIDGHAQIFRAYFAIRGGMTSPITGESTNATFGFVAMLHKLYSDFHPDYVAMAIDSAGPTFRDSIYPEYKATRTPPPDDFRPQVARILEVSQLYGIPILEHPDAEADDVIATVVERVLADPSMNDVFIRVASKDKDLEQLIGPRVSLFDIQTDSETDLDTLQRDKGVTPEQVVDLLVLMGDNVDNIPGVKGVGVKTASKLIAEHGSVDGMMQQLDALTPKQRENVEAAAPFFGLARRLVTLKRDVEMAFDPEAARVRPIDVAGLTKVFTQLGFNRHIRELKGLVGGSDTLEPTRVEVDQDAMQGGLFGSAGDHEPTLPMSTTPADDGWRATYSKVTTREEMDGLIEHLKAAELIAVDTETTGIAGRADLCGLCFSWEEGSGVYVPVLSPDPTMHLDWETVRDMLRPVLESDDLHKTLHHAKFDMQVLRHAGVELRGVVCDSMIAGYLLQLPGVGLDAMTLALLGHTMIPITSLIGESGRGRTQLTMDQVDLDAVAPYAAEDADATLRLTRLLTPKLEERGMASLFRDVEVPLSGVLADMEWAGIRVDPDTLDQQREVLETRIVELRDEVRERAGETQGENGGGFNPDSVMQLREVLFEKLKFPVIKKVKTGPSTDIEVLQKLADREDLDQVPERARLIPELLIEYRQLTKLVGTYLTSLKEAIREDTKRVHPSFNQTVTATGRLSSSDPNLQNIPIRTEVGRAIRKAFVAEEGHVLLGADYSQIELRMLAHLAEDEALIEAFEGGRDIHAAVAAETFGVPLEQVTPEQRGRAKTINFGIIYGVTPFGLARRIEGMSVDDARTLIDGYKSRFSGIDRFLTACVDQARTEGHVTTILGRRRDIEQVHDRNPQQRALGERLAINTVVQGSAADLIKLAMLRVHGRIKREARPYRLLLQIHDELVLEVPKEDAEAAAELVREEMEAAMQLRVPLRVDVGWGASWFEAK